MIKAAAILAGGESRRFGADKAMAEIGGAPMIAHVARALNADALAVVGNGAAAAALGAVALSDPACALRGPLAGVLAALEWAETLGASWLITAPCDVPLLPPDFGARLIAAAEAAGAPAAHAATSDGVHALCAAWRPFLAGALRAHFARGRWSFDPSRRWPGGVRELRFRSSVEPEDGDYVIAEVPLDGPSWLVEVLGADDRPEWDDHAIASQFRLRTRFPDAVEAEAAAFAEPGERERAGRLDLRDRLVFTIDPADARDHDDALSLRALAPGRWEVGIHIADVSWYVREGSALDTEALERGTSCYLPGRVVPMLPERLSSDLCSLREGVDRLALSVLATLDANGGEIWAKLDAGTEDYYREVARSAVPWRQARLPCWR